MKKKNIIIVVAIGVGIVIAGTLIYHFKTKKKDVKYVAEVDNVKITLDEFNAGFDLYLQMKYGQDIEKIMEAKNSMQERKEYLRELINRKLLMLEAQKAGIPEREDVKQAIKFYTETLIIQAYLSQIINLEEIKPTDKEIDKYYAKHRSKLKGLSPLQAKKYIEYQLAMLKSQYKIGEIVEKLRGKYKIIEHDEVLRPIFSTEMTNIQKKTNRRIIPQINIRVPQTPGKQQ